MSDDRELSVAQSPDAGNIVSLGGLSVEETAFFFNNDHIFQTAFNHAPIGMALIGFDGRLLRTNHALSEIVGYTELEFSSTTIQALTHPEDAASDQAKLQELLGSRISSYQMEKRFFHRNGRIVWTLLSVSLVRSRNGTPLFFILQIQNIDEQRRMQQELKDRNQELTAALREVKQLRGIVPICMYCKSIRDDSNFWHRVEAFVAEHSAAQFSHCVCPECMERFKRDLLPEES
jgi:PAS domain S-box-containing protein